MDTTVFEFLDLKLMEPATFISDFALGIACIFFYRSLWNYSYLKTHRQFALFFLFMAFSGFIGAFAHLLFLYTGKPLQIAGWIMSCISIYYIENAILNYLTEKTKRQFYEKLIKIQFLMVMLAAFLFRDFLWIKLNIAIGLLVVVSPILTRHYFETKSKGNMLIISGIVLAILPALFHNLPFDFDGIINLNDFSHYFLIVCLFLMFSGFKGMIEFELEAEVVD